MPVVLAEPVDAGVLGRYLAANVFPMIPDCSNHNSTLDFFSSPSPFFLASGDTSPPSPLLSSATACDTANTTSCPIRWAAGAMSKYMEFMSAFLLMQGDPFLNRGVFWEATLLRRTGTDGG